MSNLSILNKHQSSKKLYRGFTIVELLVVIVVIGILAAITVVSYSGITKKANETAIISNLDNNSKKLELYKALNGSYPTELNDDNCPQQPAVDTSNCLKAMGSDTINYSTPDNGLTYTLTETNSTAGITAKVTDSAKPVLIATSTAWTVPSDGVAGTDRRDKAGLIWSYPLYKDASNAITFSSTTYTTFGWDGSGSNSGGKTATQLCSERGNGWRLPTKDEVTRVYTDAIADGILKGANNSPSYLNQAFTGASGSTWTSTAGTTTNPPSAYFVNVQSGYSFSFPLYVAFSIRCVR